MISIENTVAEANQKRFTLNVPFSQIEMQFGHSNAVLQKLDLTDPLVVWLDYDGLLDSSCIADLKYVAKRAPSGSLLLVSANADAQSLEIDSDDPDAPKGVLAVLKSLVGNDAVSPAIKASDLSGGGVASVFRDIIDNSINDAVRNRNTEVAEEHAFVYQQLYNFRYKDNARMVTVGGMIFSESDREKFTRSSFDQLSFIRKGVEAYSIDPPLLTFSEMRRIDAAKDEDLPGLAVPTKDIERYKSTYRYFPNFVEAEVT
ncbi:TPA: hypothetical protein QDZ34_000879 [Stenotrophomonas maltophilia]|nr:hypothetical protein [Stenotrophomonas maltophilia]HDS1024611.1 hypothetical protein [Stenotrophomonas maltophilia]HDS1028995.1 hypothetical protein [Stenotrophomonas maltophilia]HDS1033563.1 hypothetical protein [Stenotrophomonas maltophilia]